MSDYKFIAIPQETADQVRNTMKSPGYGHPAHREVVSGYGPCRLCLKIFEIGKEERILFTLDPFYGLENLPLPGPVSIHAAECTRYDEMPGFPEALRAHPLTLNGYTRGRRMLVQYYINDERVDLALDRVLMQAEVDYVHVRDTNAGCYDLRVERRMEDKR